MTEMSLAEKVACDFQRDESELLAGMKKEHTRLKNQMADMRAKGHALAHVRSSFYQWIPRLEKSADPQANRTAREMRNVLKKVEGLLNNG